MHLVVARAQAAGGHAGVVEDDIELAGVEQQAVFKALD